MTIERYSYIDPKRGLITFIDVRNASATLDREMVGRYEPGDADVIAAKLAVEWAIDDSLIDWGTVDHHRFQWLANR